MSVQTERAGCGFLDDREIEGWLDGSLSAARRRAFEEHARGCPACTLLAADLDVFREVASRGPLPIERREHEQTRAIVRAQLRRRLDSGSAPGARRPLRFRWAMSGALAAGLAVVAVGLVLLRGPSMQAPARIQGVAIDPMPFSRPPRVRGAESLVENWRRAETAYAAGRYTEAAAALGAVVERDPDDHDAWLYRGIALTLAGRSTEAQDALARSGELARTQDLGGAADDYWYGVAALQAGDEAAARQALERAREAGGVWSARATELLERLPG